MEADCTHHSRSVNKVVLAGGLPTAHPRIILRRRRTWVESCGTATMLEAHYISVEGDRIAQIRHFEDGVI